MHLARKTHASDRIAREIRVPQCAADGDRGSSPPVARVLFGPTWMWAGEGSMLFGSGAQNLSRFVDNDSARTACSDVDANKSDVPSSAESSIQLDDERVR